MTSSWLTGLIVVGLVLGIVLGYAVHVIASATAAISFADGVVSKWERELQGSV